jgi:tRNA (cytidine/uridine-2'-O-)-methyltransferase
MSGQEFNIVLYEPVIPQNTGSIARLCACTGARLHLIEPLGFQIDEASVKRAGLDYWPHVWIKNYSNWTHFLEETSAQNLIFFSKLAQKSYTEAPLIPGTYLVFGSETKGLPESLWKLYEGFFYTVPMRTHLVRSLNLSQCAAIVLYESLRQNSFATIK